MQLLGSGAPIYFVFRNFFRDERNVLFKIIACLICARYQSHRFDASQARFDSLFFPLPRMMELWRGRAILEKPSVATDAAEPTSFRSTAVGRRNTAGAWSNR
jgi:hypothetical protein